MKRILICLLFITVCACDGRPQRGTSEYGVFLERHVKLLADKMPDDPDVNLFVALYADSFGDAERYFLRVVKNRDDRFGNLYVGAFYADYFALGQHGPSDGHTEQARTYLDRAAALDANNAVPRTMLVMLDNPALDYRALEHAVSGSEAPVINFYPEEFTVSMVRALQKLEMFNSYDVLYASAINTPATVWGDRINATMFNVLNCDSVRNLSWRANYAGVDKPKSVFQTLHLELILWQALARTRLSEQAVKCGLVSKQAAEQNRATLIKLRDESKIYRQGVKAGLFLNPALTDQQNKEWEVARDVAEMSEATSTKKLP
jgi:hypothetical protein